MSDRSSRKREETAGGEASKAKKCKEAKARACSDARAPVSAVLAVDNGLDAAATPNVRLTFNTWKT